MNTGTLAEPVTAHSAAAPSQALVEAYAFSRSLVMVSNPSSRAAEAIRTLRTHIMAQHIHEGRRGLAVCAPSLGVGVSFVAANLAVALSQTGRKTLLIDGDLRRPSLHQFVRPPAPRGGLAHVLTSEDADFSGAIDDDVLPDLSVTYAGAASANPQELLAGGRFKAFIDFCQRDFDVTIVDTPPANSCSDARRIGAVVGYCLIVAGRDQTFAADVKTLAGQLQADHARVVGTVLNRA